MYKIVAAIALSLILIQFVPYGKNHKNPAVVAEPEWAGQRTRELFFRACADCHSHETKWPWYSRYAPASWLVTRDVQEGRKHFNISAWGTQKKNHGDEAAHALLEGEMPPWFYVLPHPEAKLSDEEKAALVKGLQQTFGTAGK